MHRANKILRIFLVHGPRNNIAFASLLVYISAPSQGVHWIVFSAKPALICGGKKNGEMSEWPKEHAWKVCIPQGIEGSTPSLTAILSKVPPCRIAHSSA